MKQYLDLCQRIIDEGVWVENQRTGKRCLTVIDASLTYNVADNEFPLITTRKSFWKAAIAELLGYIRAMTMQLISVNWAPKRGMRMPMKMRRGLPIRIAKVRMIWGASTACRGVRGVNQMAKRSISCAKSSMI